MKKSRKCKTMPFKKMKACGSGTGRADPSLNAKRQMQLQMLKLFFRSGSLSYNYVKVLLMIWHFVTETAKNSLDIKIDNYYIKPFFTGM